MAERKPLFMDAEGFSSEMPTTDTASFGGLTLGGDIAMGTNKVTGLGAGTAADDAVNKSQLDAAVSGLDTKQSVRVATAAAMPANTAAGSGVLKTLTMDAVGILTIDGIATVLGDRILVKDESAGADIDHGIYEVTLEGTAGVAAVLTRSDDFDEDAEVTASAYCFVNEGTVNADTGWTVTTDNPIVVDTTAIAWAQFNGLGAVTAGAGLGKTGNDLFVNAGDGIEIVTDNVEVDLNGTTISKGASGIAVVGVPLNFEVNGVAVSANVTAANLNELTGGGATTLHTHAGSDEAARVENDLAVGSAVAIGDPVYFTATNDRIAKADAGTLATTRPVGLARLAQSTVGNTTPVVSNGICTGAVAGATAGDRYYLGVGGGLTTTRPVGSGNRVIQMGFAKNATDLWVEIQDYGRAA